MSGAELPPPAGKAAPAGVGQRWFAAFGVLLALLGALAYKTGVDRINELSDRIDNARVVQRQKIDELVSSVAVDSVSVRSATDDEFVQGAITYTKDDFDTFNITFEVPVYIDVRGRGAGSVLGLKVLYDDRLMKLFATHADGVENHRVYDLYRNGVFFNLDKPVQITQGLSFLYTASYSFHRSSCAEVRKIVESVAGKMYDVQAQPFLNNAREASEPKTFHASFAEDSLYRCE